MTRTIYALYDARYPSDRAIVYTTEYSLKEAKRSRREMFGDAVIVKQTMKSDGNGSFTVTSSEIIP